MGHSSDQFFILVQFQSHPFLIGTEISFFKVRERVDSKKIEDLAAKCKKKEESSNKAAVEVKQLF